MYVNWQLDKRLIKIWGLNKHLVKCGHTKPQSSFQASDISAQVARYFNQLIQPVGNIETENFTLRNKSEETCLSSSF